MKNKDLLADKIEKKVISYIRENQLIEEGDSLLIGLSGGADSVCLFLLLREIVRKGLLGDSITISALHVNHQLRQSAERDENFAKDLCARYEIPFQVVAANVTAYAKEKKMTLEEAGRELRYHAFQERIDSGEATKIAVAHHMQDQAETVLFQLCRGSGIEGLGGIRPRRGDVIRPLLCLSKQEILGYVVARGESFVTDETNEDTAYSRNFLRWEVIPMLEEKINQETVRHISDSALLLQEAQDYLRQQVEEAYKKCYISSERTSDRQRVILQMQQLASLPVFLQKEVVRRALFYVAGRKKDIGQVHVKDVLALLSKQSGAHLDLPYEMKATTSFLELEIWRANSSAVEKSTLTIDGECLETEKENRQDQVQEELEVAIPSSGEKEVLALGEGKCMQIRVFQKPIDADIPRKTYTKWFDYDKIEGSLSYRGIQDVDYFFFDDQHRKLLKDYLKDLKLPQSKRADLRVLAQGEHILYLVGGRISNFFKVTETTKQVLEIVVEGIEEV